MGSFLFVSSTQSFLLLSSFLLCQVPTFKVYTWRESVKLSIFVKHGKFSIFLCCCITMLVCKNELHILHCCISNYKFALLHWFVGESYTCYVVMLLQSNYWFQHFWTFGCCIVIFWLLTYQVFLSYSLFSIDLVFFPWGCLWTLYVKFNCFRFCKSFGSCKLFVSSFIFWFCASFYFWPCN